MRCASVTAGAVAADSATTASPTQPQQSAGSGADTHLAARGSRENVLELIQACDQGEQAQVARILRRPQDVNTLMPLPNNNDEDTSDDDSEYGDRVAVAVVVVVVVVVVGVGYLLNKQRG